MNAFVRELSTAVDVSEAMALDLLGYSNLPPSSLTYHATLSSLETGGPLSLADCTSPAGTHIARHVHYDEDEILVVLSGTVEVSLHGRRFCRGAGESAFIARGIEHEVRALTEARHIAILTRKSLEAPPPP
jgi:quercetin dioxygenase-like cupin family protein